MVNQVLVRCLDGRTSCFVLEDSAVTAYDILLRCVATKSGVLPANLLLATGTSILHPDSVLRAGPDGLFPSCHVSCRVLGGKGGFGSLLRGQATRAGQKKTSNFDACRDMSGRRLRHVNAEKKLKDWKQEASERQLEKVAQDYIKKVAKERKKAKQAVAVSGELRERSAQTIDRVAEAVKLGMAASRRQMDLEKKRKREGEELENKKKMMSGELGLLGVVEDDDDDEDGEDGAEEDEEEEESEEELSQEDDEDENEGDGQEGKSASSGGEGGAASTSGQVRPEARLLDEEGRMKRVKGAEEPSAVSTPPLEDVPGSMTSLSLPAKKPRLEPSEPAIQEAASASNVAKIEIDAARPKTSPSKPAESEGSLDWGKVSSPSDLEALGLDRLKAELAKNGLKCGGTLQERAARLFLLKDTTVHKLDKKLFARPPRK